jgi:hypothetical protein
MDGQHMHDEHHDDDRRQVVDEVVERQINLAADQDVRRVADQGRRAADVRGDDLREQERVRIDLQRLGDHQRHRHRQQHRRDVVEKGGDDGGHHREHGEDSAAQRALRAAAQSTLLRWLSQA